MDQDAVPGALGEEPAGLASGAPAGPSTSPVVRLRGLPFSAGEDDIRAFFGDITVVNVVLCRRSGRATGEAYVQLESPEAVTDAVAKLHRQTLGHRYIELFYSSEADLATAKSLSVDRMRGFVVRCRGLPYTATATDVLGFFGDIPVVRGLEGVVFTYSPDGRPTGEAYVEFQTEEAQREALKKHKETIGSRYIELFVSGKADMFQAIQQNRMVLGYNNRRRWLQQQGYPPMMMGPGGPHPAMMGHHPHHPHHPRQAYAPQHPPPYGGGGGRGGGMHGRGRPQAQYGQVEEMTEMMAGFSVGSQPIQLIGPGGQMLPPGTYQLEVSGGKGGQGHQQGAAQRYPNGQGAGFAGGRGGRGQAGRGGGYQQQQPQGFAGRGGGMGRGMQHQQQQQQQQVISVQQPMAQQRQAQMVSMGTAGQTVLVQEVAAGHQGAAQYIIQQQQQGQAQYEQSAAVQQQQWGGQHVIVQQGPPGTAYGGQQGGTYTLAAIQMPGGGGGAGGYQTVEYQQVHHHHGLQSLDMQPGSGGLQAVELGSNMGATLQIEVPVSALGPNGEMLLQRGTRYDGHGHGQGGM